MTERQRAEQRLARGWMLIPGHMHESIRLYVLDGLKSGDFLQALLSNDLILAATKADHMNFDSLGNWVRYLVNCCPAACFGGPEEYENWKGISDEV